MLILKYGTEDFRERLDKIVRRMELTWDQGIERSVQEIIRTVKAKGDEALIEYTRRFDHCHLSKQDLLVSKEEIVQAYQAVDNKAVEALQFESSPSTQMSMNSRSSISRISKLSSETE